MKILVIYHALQMGGVDSVVAKQVNWWAENGYDVTLALFANEKTPQHYSMHPGVNTIYMDIFDSSDSPINRIKNILQRHWTIRQTVKKQSPDIIISHVDTVNIRVLLSTIGLPIPIVVVEHTDPVQYDLGRIWGILRKAMYKRAAHVIVLNEHMRKYFTRFLNPEQVEAFPNPIPLPSRSTHTPRNSEILYLGRLSQEKGVAILIRAFALTKTTGWTLILAGDGPDKSELKELVRSLGIKDKTVFLGPIKDVFQQLDRAGIYVLPSFYEGFPMALSEAMVSGAPCLATRTHGALAIIRDDINGILTPIGDPKSMAEKLDMLMQSPLLRNALEKAAIELRDYVGIDKVMGKWNALLDNLTAKKAP